MEERIYQGSVYRRNAPGEPWQRVGPAPDAQPTPQAAPSGGIVIGTPRADPVPAGYQRNPDGSVTYIPGGPADPSVIARNSAMSRAPQEPNQPNPGVGYMMDGGRAVPIPGGPADTAAQGNPDQANGVRTDALDKIALARRLIARSRGEWFGTGFLAPTMSNISGTSAADIAADVETLRAGGAINEVMRLASTNGGKNPLTPLSNADMQMLGNSLSNLDISQSDEQFQRNVQSIINLYERAYMASGGTPQTYAQELAGRLTPEEKQDHLNALVRRNASPDEVRAAAQTFFGQANPDLAQWLDRYQNGDRNPVMVVGATATGTPPSDGGGPSGGGTGPGGIADLIAGRDRLTPSQRGLAQRDQYPLDSFIRSAANMATGGFGNKIVSGLNAVLPIDRLTGKPVYSVWDGSSLGDAFNRNLALETRITNADRIANPAASLAGDVTGGVMGALTVARVAPGTAAAGAFAPRALAADAAFGSTVAGNEAYDRGQSVAPAAGLGALAGAAGGVVGRGVIAPLAGAAMRSAPGQAVANAVLTGVNAPRNALRGMFGRNPVPAPRITPPPTVSGPQAMLAQNVGDPAQAGQMLSQAQDLGLPLALADTSPALRRLAGAAFRRSGDEVRNAADATVRSRSLGQADRALGQIEGNFGPIANPNRVSEQLMSQARTNSQPLYDAAFARPAPVDPELQALLNTPAGQDALRAASTIARNDGVDPNSLGFGMNDLGEITYEQAPSYRTLDYIKKGFDANLEPLRNEITGRLPTNNPAVAALQGLRSRYRSRLDELNPDYAAARTAFAGPASSAEAMRLGQSSLRMQPRDIQDTLGRLGPEQSDQFRLGARVALGDRVTAAADSRNPYTAIYGSPVAQQRLGAMFPPQSVDRFGQAYNLESQMGQTAQELLGGSPTAARAMADAQFGEDLMGHAANAVVDTMATGAPVRSLLQMGRNALGDRLKMGIGQAGQRRADALLPDLLNTDPAAAKAVMDEAIANSAQALNYNRRMRRVGGMFGYGAVGAGLPLLSQ